MNHKLVAVSSWILATAFSANGKRLVSGSSDGTVCVWDTKSWNMVAKLTKDKYVPRDWTKVMCVAISSDGGKVAFGSEDGLIRVWHTTETRPLLLIRHVFTSDPKVRHPLDVVGSIGTIAFSPDDKMLSSASYCSHVQLWDAESGIQLPRPPNQSNGSHKVVFSPDGKTIACALTDQTVQIWDVESGNDIQKLNGHASKICSVAFSPKGYIVASGSSDDTVRLWNVKTGVEFQRLQGHYDNVECVCFSPDGKTVASGSLDGTVRLWDWLTGKLVRIYTEVNEVYGISYSPDAQTIAIATNHPCLHLWRPLESKNYEIDLLLHFPVYVVLHIVNFLKAIDHCYSMEIEERFAHGAKIKCLERLKRTMETKIKK